MLAAGPGGGVAIIRLRSTGCRAMTSDAVRGPTRSRPTCEVDQAPAEPSFAPPPAGPGSRAAGTSKCSGSLQEPAAARPNLDHLRLSGSDGDSETRCAALLFRLDRLGLLARGLSSGGRRLVSCVPLRPPPQRLRRTVHPRGRSGFRHVRSRARRQACALEAAGSWARMTIHDRDLLPLLHDLAVGRLAAEIAAAAVVIRRRPS